jgi:transcriptional regulator
MYIPPYFSLPDLDEQLSFMKANSFAVLVSKIDGEMHATHLPVHMKREADRVRATCHLAKPNPQAAALAQESDVLLIFNGPHGYVSPSNYDKIESVPTWNYIAVHVYGRARIVADKQSKLAQMADLIGHYEAAFQLQWDSLSDKYRDGMLSGIVALDIEVLRIEGKAKLSQNRSIEDQARVADWLLHHASAAPRALGAEMKRRMGGS